MASKFQGAKWINIDKAVWRKLFYESRNSELMEKLNIEKLTYEYNEADICNADETALFTSCYWRSLVF